MSSNTKVSLLVQPGAARSEVVDFTDGAWRIRVAAPPVKGKANKELIALLSQALGVSKASITIASGFTSRRKVLTIDGLSQDEVLKRLSPKPSSSSGGDATSRPPRQQLSRPG